jgi:hypothetical protein
MTNFLHRVQTTRTSRPPHHKYYPDGDKTDRANVYGPSIAQTLVQVLKQCGDDSGRDNVMKQAADLHS